MKCMLCKGNMEETTTIHAVEVDGRIIIIKNVPCKKCTLCGEIVYSGVTLKKLEELINAVKSALTEVAIVNYTDKVA